MLYALLAVAIPILVHLFNFRRYKKIYFPNVDMLQSIHKKTKKQSELKHLLLLLARILTIIAIVLAFAQPYFPNKHSLINNQEKQWVSLYLDNSFSMTQKGEVASLLDEAKNMALGILDSYQTTDKFHLITNEMQGKHHRWFNKMEMEQNILQVEAVYMQQKLSHVLQREKMLRENENSNKQNQKALLYLLSDFQENIIDKQNIKPDTNLLVRLLPLQNNPVNNVFIDSLWFEKQIQLPHSISKIWIRVNNNGEEDLTNIPLRLYINDEQKAVVSISIAAHKSKTIDLSFTNGSGGNYTGKVEIDDYPIIFDDQYYFNFRIRHQLKVAVLYQDKPNVYLRHLYKNDSLVKYTDFSWRNIDYKQVKSQDLIILNELEKIGSGLQQELIQYTKDGGQLLFIPSSNKPLAYNSLLKSLRAPKYQSLDSNSTFIADIEKQLPYYHQVFEQYKPITKDHEKIDMPLIKMYFPIAFSANTTAIRLLQTRGKKVLLSESHFNKGNIYQLAFPLSLQYSNLPEHALFVPVFYQMLLQSEDRKPLYQIVGSGESVDIQNNNTISQNDEVLHISQNETQWIPQMKKKNAYQWQLINLQWPNDGIFNITLGDSLLEQLAVNYDRGESDFSLWTAEEIRQWIAQEKYKYFQVIESSTKNISSRIIQLDHGTSLWKWFVFFAIIFIFAETLILRLWK